VRTRPTPHRTARSSQRGLTLVELMVGLTLGLLVTAALLLVFANASATGRELNRASMQIETGRYVSELLAEDVRLAGFFGETQLAAATPSNPDPCSTDPNPVATPNWVSTPLTLPAAVRGYRSDDVLACATHRRTGTDAVAVRRVSTEATTQASLSATNTQHYVQYSFCESDPVATKLVFGTAKAAFTLRNRACAAANPLRAYVSRVYFIAACNRCGAGGDTHPTLKRVDLVNGALVETALAEGVEMLRIEYGFDVDNNGSADTYMLTTDAGVAGATWGNVVALKLHFVTRSLDKAVGGGLASAQSFQLGGTGAYNGAADGYTRRAYTTVVRLVNPSSAREVQ
jgi:type IV pilus assembly protein PilW